MKTVSLRGLAAALVFAAVATPAAPAADWKPAGDRIKTVWAEKVSPTNPLPEYPRPLLVRDQWQNLNGLWDYAITPQAAAAPAAFDGKILVPFPVESSLSGVQKGVGAGSRLWYNREFTVPAAWAGKKILLNFGAVDWEARVEVNGNHVGTHTGGYTPFSFDITPHLKKDGANKLVVRVYDSTGGFQPRGKQVPNPGNIWYTPVTGIWQTVWLEPVPVENHIGGVRTESDIDNNTLAVFVDAAKTENTDAEVRLLDKGQVVATAKGAVSGKITLNVANPKLWSPDSPFLYDLEVTLLSGGTTKTETVKSYTAFRKISMKRDGSFPRFQLNNKYLFHFGPLDQGWWPDGLYTAPTDEALLFDIKKTKEWGFNMIRKHVKVEPARWYYHCDKEGMLVWQDMPNGDGGGSWDPKRKGGGRDVNRNAASKANFYKEWKEIIDLCRPHPSVVVWVPFNESWGQFDTQQVSAWTKKYDPSRLVNAASGGNYRDCGDIFDLHDYPFPRIIRLRDKKAVNVLGEYGGIGLSIQGHLWGQKSGWGYIGSEDKAGLTKRYVGFARQLEQHVRDCFSAAVYTQTTDVESEVNGLMTYDRKVIKIDEAKVRTANQAVIKAMEK
ncbi:MAG: hypothetical protein LBT53_09140 [Puniceicoccales bacterium]|jgi:beta-galactosidase/beta-glucuronidase|nr:hypothetical protein [Puniceicoccales bacterium]